ncbi:MAG TPA: xanthine dehydrogenase family protein molybdopterin-binding subunit [Phycisphaerae bacterium]|nr:xanthine dehydrogenase family protein molybdopterin-binding subunit [Phycisphaerae bacterium]
MPDTDTTNQPAGAAADHKGMRKVVAEEVINGQPTGKMIESWVPDSGLSWGPKDKHKFINQRVPRPDAPAKTTGTAKYTYDISVPGMLHGMFLGSPHAHARIKSIDTSAATKLPGVRAVLTIPGEIKYEGQPIAAIAAETIEAAADAIKAIVVDYDVLKHVVTIDDALKPDGVKLFPGGRPKSRGNEAAVDEAFAGCDAVIEAEYRTRIWHHCCLESHGVVVDYSGGNNATIYASTQGTFTIPNEAARELGLDVADVKAVVHHMGGGFGSKFGPGITGLWAIRLSKQTKTPVKMMLTRRDEFLTSGNGPGSLQKFKAGVKKDGTLVAFKAEQHAQGGIGNSGLAAQPYQYKAGTVFTTQTNIYTNEDASCPMRAPGHPQACFAMESLMDELAEKINMDPIEFRKKNTTEEAWHRQLDVGAERIGWSKRNMKAGADSGPLKRGFGCGIGAWGGGGHRQCVVTVNVYSDGRVTVESGTQDLGTGTRGYVRGIVAEELGLNYDDVLEEIGESTFGNANSSGGSTTAASLAPAVKDAAVNARVELAKRVAPLLGLKPDDYNQIALGNRQVFGNGKTLKWEEACKAVPSAGLSVRGEWKAGLSGNGAHGASFAEVEVDTETGHIRVVRMCHVQDGGLILNRLTAESQINGGMIQSIGGALYEARFMDSDLGVMLNPGFNDYKLIGTMEIPELIPVIDDGDERNVVIGIAEPANIPGIGAIANAVYNACGVRIRELPITPDQILNGLMKA